VQSATDLTGFSYSRREAEMDLVKTIRQHTGVVRSGKTERHRGCCHKCRQDPQHFTRHDAYRRQVRVIHGDAVEVLTTLLVRLRCPLCRATFAEYPPFLLPHKRYAATDITKLSADYVSDEQQTYRRIVSCENIPYGYVAPGSEIDERQLSPSSVWRWLTFLARLFSPPQAALLPPPAIAAQKYRSSSREQQLRRACLILFGEPKTKRWIFPHFATA